MNYAIRSGIAITSGYALDQCSRLLKAKDSLEKDELSGLRELLESKIRIISPAIDMIELITARGNSSLDSAVVLTKSLRWDIQSLGTRLANAAADDELFRLNSSRAKPKTQLDENLSRIVSDMRALLQKIEHSVPLINLAISTSGVSLSSSLPVSVSPSRLLQASAFLNAGDAEYNNSTSTSVQIGPTFILSTYMLFAGHSLATTREQDAFRSAVWKEVIHKARLKIVRTPIADLYSLPHMCSSQENEKSTSRMMLGRTFNHEFAYQMVLIEDLDDGRVHIPDEEPDKEADQFYGILRAGIREVLPIHEISKIFYADTGKVLNLGAHDEMNNPVLLLKRDPNASPPRRMMEPEVDSRTLDSLDQSAAAGTRCASFTAQTEKCQADNSDVAAWRLPPGLDPEWIAFEVFSEDQVSDEDSDSETEATSSTMSAPTPCSFKSHGSINPELVPSLSSLRLTSSSPIPSREVDDDNTVRLHSTGSTPEPISSSTLSNESPTNVRTSLSLLEMLIRLTSLQQFQQESHLTISDELLNFFLKDSSTTGAASGDSDARKRIRMDARQRVGFDPYTESPVKRRDEQNRSSAELQQDGQLGNQPLSSRDSSPANLEEPQHSPLAKTTP